MKLLLRPSEGGGARVRFASELQIEKPVHLRYIGSKKFSVTFPVHLPQFLSVVRVRVRYKVVPLVYNIKRLSGEIKLWKMKRIGGYRGSDVRYSKGNANY